MLLQDLIKLGWSFQQQHLKFNEISSFIFTSHLSPPNSSCNYNLYYECTQANMKIPVTFYHSFSATQQQTVVFPLHIQRKCIVTSTKASNRFQNSVSNKCDRSRGSSPGLLKPEGSTLCHAIKCFKRSSKGMWKQSEKKWPRRVFFFSAFSRISAFFCGWLGC